MEPTPVFLPGESHGPRSLAAYSPWGHKEADMTEHTCTTGIQDLIEKEPGSSLHCMAFTWLSSYASFWCLLILSLLLRTGSLTLSLLCCLVAKSCPTLCDPMDCSTPGFPVLHYLPEFAPDSSCCLFRHLNPSWLWLSGLLSPLCLMTFMHLLLLHHLSSSALPCFGCHFHSGALDLPLVHGIWSNSGEGEQGFLTLPSVRQPGRAAPF